MSTCTDVDAALARLESKINALQQNKVNEQSIIDKAVNATLATAQITGLLKLPGQFGILQQSVGATLGGIEASIAGLGAFQTKVNVLSGKVGVIENSTQILQRSYNQINSSVNTIQSSQQILSRSQELLKSNVEARVNNLQSAVNSVNTRLGNVSAQVGNLAGQINGVATRFAPLAALLGVVGALVNIAAIAGALLSLAQLVGTLTVIFPRLDAHDRQLDVLNQGLSDNLGQVQRLKSRQDRLEGDIGSVNQKTDEATRIANLANSANAIQNAQIDNVNGRVSQTQTELNLVKSTVNQHSSDIGQLNTNQQNLDKRVVDVNNKTNNNTLAIEQTNKNLTGTANRVTKVESSIQATNGKLDTTNERVTRVENKVNSLDLTRPLIVAQEAKQIAERVGQQLPPVQTIAQTASVNAIQAKQGITGINDKVVAVNNIANNAQNEIKRTNSVFTDKFNQNQADLQQIRQNIQNEPKRVFQQQILTNNKVLEQTVTDRNKTYVDAQIAYQNLRLRQQEQLQLQEQTRVNNLTQTVNNNNLQVNQNITNLTINNGMDAAAKAQMDRIERNTQDNIRATLNGINQTVSNGIAIATIGLVTSTILGRLGGLTNIVNNVNTNIVNNISSGAELALLSVINNKLGNQIAGGLSSHVKNGFKLVEGIYNSDGFNKALTVMTYVTTLHNAAMLSNSLASTLFAFIGSSLDAIGIEKRTVNDDGTVTSEPFDIAGIVSQYTTGFMVNLFGLDFINGTKEAWAKFNRIYQATANIFYTVQGLMYSVRTIGEYTAERVGILGNALKRWRVVGEKAYPDMSERVTSTTPFQAKLDKAVEGIGTIDNALSGLSSVSSEVISIQENFATLTTTQKTEFETSIKEGKLLVEESTAGAANPRAAANEPAKLRKEEEKEASVNESDVSTTPKNADEGDSD